MRMLIRFSCKRRSVSPGGRCGGSQMIVSSASCSATLTTDQPHQDAHRPLVLLQFLKQPERLVLRVEELTVNRVAVMHDEPHSEVGVRQLGLELTDDGDSVGGGGGEGGGALGVSTFGEVVSAAGPMSKPKELQ